MLNHQSGEYLRLDDAEIYYEVTGNPQGHPLLLLHGGMGNIEDFSAIVEALADSFRIIAVDLRGHGKSTLGVKSLTYEQHQCDVQALVSFLDLVHYSILGFSDGGIIGYRMASGSVDITAVVTVGSQWRITQHDKSFRILAGVTPSSWDRMFPDAASKYSAINPEADFDKLVRACVRLWTDLEPTGYPYESISEITCPTLIMRGDEDFLLSLPEAAEAQEAIPSAKLGNIPFAGHAAIEDSPEICSKIIIEFLRRSWGVEVQA